MKFHRIWITASLLQKENNSQLFLGTAAHESLAATHGASKTSQQETNVEHENFTVSNHIIFS